MAPSVNCLDLLQPCIKLGVWGCSFWLCLFFLTGKACPGSPLGEQTAGASSVLACSPGGCVTLLPRPGFRQHEKPGVLGEVAQLLFSRPGSAP